MMEIINLILSGKYILITFDCDFPDGRSVHPDLKDGGALQISLQHFQVFQHLCSF
jgi:hypothetical protein